MLRDRARYFWLAPLTCILSLAYSSTSCSQFCTIFLSTTLDHLRISHRISPSHQFTIDECPMDPHGGRVNQDGVGTLVSFLHLRGRRGILTMVGQEATSVMIVKHCKGIFGSTRQD